MFSHAPFKDRRLARLSGSLPAPRRRQCRGIHWQCLVAVDCGRDPRHSLLDPRPIEQSANAPLDARLVYGAFALAVAWVVVSWIPLPPAIWHALPGRVPIEESDALLAMTDNWRSISVQPTQSLLSIFALLPPLAVFAMTLRASERSRELTLWSIVGFAALSSLVGLIQLSQGVGGAAYFYEDHEL